MEDYFEILKTYIAGHPPDSGDGNAQSILEMLYTCYNQYNRMDTEEAGFDDLYRHMNGIPLRDMDGIINTVSARRKTPVLRQARQGFFYGLTAPLLGCSFVVS